MNNVELEAVRAIERAKNLKEFLVFRDMDDIVFDGNPLPYTITHIKGCSAEIIVPAISQEEAEQRVNEWLRAQRV